MNFVEHLSDYLRSSPAASTRIPTLRTTLRLPVYKQFTIHIPPVSQVTQDITKDVVHTRRAVAQKGTTAASPSRFDTILAQEEGRGMEKEHALEGESCFMNNYLTVCTDKFPLQDWPSPKSGPSFAYRKTLARSRNPSPMLNGTPRSPHKCMTLACTKSHHPPDETSGALQSFLFRMSSARSISSRSLAGQQTEAGLRIISSTNVSLSS